MNEEHPIQGVEVINPVLYSDYTDAPMTECSICGTNLYGAEIPYLIEKSMFRDPTGERILTRFELAVCMPCHQKMQGEMSVESLEAINQFMDENSHLDERREALSENNTCDLDTWTNACIVSGTNKEALKGYHIYAQCIGDKMIFHDAPFIIGEEALEMMQELLSSKTKDELDHFNDEFLGCPPELRDILIDKPIIIF